jgi:hypothetical protein
MIHPVALIGQAFGFNAMEIANAAFEAAGGWVIFRYRWETAAFQRHGHNDSQLECRNAEPHVGGIIVYPECQEILQALGTAHGKADPVPLINLQTDKAVWPRPKFGGQRGSGGWYGPLHLSSSAARSNQPTSVGGK